MKGWWCVWRSLPLCSLSCFSSFSVERLPPSFSIVKLPLAAYFALLVLCAVSLFYKQLKETESSQA